MSDPARLLKQGSDLEVRLLSSALDEPPPRDLLPRTLAAVGVAEVGAVVVAAKAAAGAKAAGGGLLGAVGLGALAGLLTVGGLQLATSLPEARPALAPLPALTATIAPHGTGPQVAVDPAPAATQPPPKIHSASRPTKAAPSASGPRPSALAAELEQLDEARRALREGDPARALTLLDRYARATPHGQMAREAAVLRAEAVAALPTNP